MASNKIKKQTGSEVDTLSFTAHTFLRDFSYLETKCTLYEALDAMGILYGRIKRSLFKDSVSTGLKPASFKNAYLKKYGITARQFNAIRYDLDGNISSAVEVLKLRIATLDDKIKSVRKWVKSKEAKVRKTGKDKSISLPEKNWQLHDLRFAVHHRGASCRHWN